MERFTYAENGWYPDLSPTGRFVTFGNEVVHVYDFETGQLRTLPNPTGGPRWAVGWLSEYVFGVFTQLDEHNRELRIVDAFTGTESLSLWPTWQFVGPMGGWGGFAEAGVFAYVPATGRFYLNGVDVTPLDGVRAGGPVRFTGTHFSYRPMYDEAVRKWPTVIRDVRTQQIVRRLENPQGEWRQDEILLTDRASQAWHLSKVVFGGVDLRSVLNTPDGEDVLGPRGESPVALSCRADELRIWTCVFDGERPVIIARTLESFRAGGPGLIVTDIWQGDPAMGVGLKVVPTAEGYRLCGHNGGGTLGVQPGTLTSAVLPYDQPEALLASVLAPPAPIVPPVAEPPAVVTPTLPPPSSGEPPLALDAELERQATDIEARQRALKDRVGG